MSILIFGSGSALTKCMKDKLLKNNRPCEIAGRKNADYFFDANHHATDVFRAINVKKHTYFIVNLGILFPKKISEQSVEEITCSLNVNLISIVQICEFILNNNKNAKVFILGSESGLKGSYDTTYFLCKAALRAYVRERKLDGENQQLLLFSPSTISDAGMTTRRTDLEVLENYRRKHPKRRLLTCDEVSDIIISFMNEKFSYVSNTEIEINGGKFARMK